MLGKFLETFEKVSEKLNESSIFWVLIAVLALIGAVMISKHWFHYSNQRLEINRKWDHHNNKLQDKAEKRRHKAMKQKQKNQEKQGKGEQK